MKFEVIFEGIVDKKTSLHSLLEASVTAFKGLIVSIVSFPFDKRTLESHQYSRKITTIERQLNDMSSLTQIKAVDGTILRRRE